MSRAVKISDDLVNEAEVYSKSYNRSIASQIEFWTKIGKISEENPDMTFNEIKDILIAKEEVSAGLVSEYKFGTKQVFVSKKKVKVLQTNLFSRKIKKLSKKQKSDLDKAILKIIENPFLGQEKKGDLIGVYVYKFKSSTQQLLLAYEWDEDTRTLLMIGVHENFYKDLKNYKK